MTTHSLFFCLRPDEATAERLAATSQDLTRRLGLRPRPPRTARLHVTLHHLDEFDDEIEERRVAMAETIRLATSAAERLREAPFRLDFDTVQSFTHKQRNMPWVLTGGKRLDGVRHFQQRLMAALGLPASGFVPHLTLGYDDLVVEPRIFVVDGWTATDFHLIDSLQGQSRHVELGRWPLGDAAS